MECAFPPFFWNDDELLKIGQLADSAPDQHSLVGRGRIDSGRGCEFRIEPAAACRSPPSARSSPSFALFCRFIGVAPLEEVLARPLDPANRRGVVAIAFSKNRPEVGTHALPAIRTRDHSGSVATTSVEVGDRLSKLNLRDIPDRWASGPASFPRYACGAFGSTSGLGTAETIRDWPGCRQPRLL